MRVIFLLIVFIFYSLLAHAQYNDSTHYYAKVAATGTINQTNTTSSYLLNNAAQFGIRKKAISLNAAGGWVYGEQNKTLSNNDIASSLTFDLVQRDTNFYYWGLANYTSSYSLKINNQYQAGGGAAYSILNSKNAYLNFSDGLLYENSDLYLSDSTRDIYSTIRNSFRIQFKFTAKNMVTFSGTAFLQNSFFSVSDYIINSNLSLSVKIYKWLQISAGWTYNKVNRTNSENALFTYGLVFEDYF